MQTNAMPVACLAPPLTDEKLATYKAMADGCDDAEVKDAMQTLLACVEKWWELPESKRRGSVYTVKHKGKDAEFPVVPMEAEHVKALWDVTPWMRELDLLSNIAGSGVFDRLKGPIRDAAFHLLWHAKEITLDREPITQDKLKV